MKLGLNPLEFFYLLIGTGILVNEIAFTQTLTTTELGAALFFFGLTAASVADREGQKGPIEFINSIVGIFRGGNGGSSDTKRSGREKEDGE